MKDQRIVYGGTCTWWDSIDKVGKTKSGGIPCCPYCRGVLFELNNMEDWQRGVDEYDKKHPGYTKKMAWARGKCFRNMNELETVYAREVNS